MGYTSDGKVCSLDGRSWCCLVEGILLAAEMQWFALDNFGRGGWFRKWDLLGGLVTRLAGYEFRRALRSIPVTLTA